MNTHPPTPSGLPPRPPLDEAAIAAGTAGTRWRVQVLGSSPSTNAALSASARAGAHEGAVVVAEHQTAGRGRLDRTWSTPDRSALTVSMLLTPDDVPVAHWPWLPLLTGVAVADAVRRVCGVGAALKWPNDVLVDGAKVAGILVERVDVPGGAAAVLGVGLNVSTTRAELPVPTATSLELVGAGRIDRTELLLAVLERLADHYDAWRAVAGDATAGLHAAYVGVCDTLGRDVRVELPSGDVAEGLATGVDAVGRLQVRTAAGTVTLGAGDVIHVRRQPRAT